MRRWLTFFLTATIAACGAAPDERGAAAGNTGLRYLGVDFGGDFAHATVPRDFVFPEDHGSHPGYRTEWWYFTGNLSSASGRHFGFELTFFRVALSPTTGSLAGASAWRTNQVWMAHFAITDTEGGRFYARERLAREANGLAGAATDPLRIWVEDWSASGTATGEHLALRLEARDENVALALNLTSTIAPVAQGDSGLDRKGSGVGNASYYYSMPRLAAAGQLSVANESVAVTGLAWLDREWSTSALEPGVQGWDWFALHLSDGSNLMFYRLRTANGEASPFSGGTLVGASGERRRLSASDVALTPLEHWTSASTGVRYPVAWRLTIAGAGVTLDVEPYLANQELDLSVRYWEGAVRAEGRGPEGALSGQGYLELAGY